MDEEMKLDKESKVNFKQTEEIIMNLEIYVECLEENVLIYKGLKNNTFTKKHEFLLEYIDLEDNILISFDKLNNLKIIPNQLKRIEILFL